MLKIYLLLFTMILSSCHAREEPSQPISTPTTEVAQIVDAPVLTAKDQDGKLIDFAKLYQESIVLVFFFPKAGTPGCTAQACSLRDAYETLTDKGVKVIGVSVDSKESQKAFQSEQNLPYPLIPDPESKVVKAFGVDQIAGLASRQAFLIKDGKIVWRDSTASTEKQAEDVLRELEKLK